MQVKVINKTAFIQYINTDGDVDNHDTTAVLGPRASANLEIASERQFLALSKELKGKVTFKKL